MRGIIPCAIVLAATVVLGCAPRSTPFAGPGITLCRPGTVANYMAASAQQCWYTTATGRWRIVNHEFHYDVLVVDTQASTRELTAEIVKRLAAVHGGRFVEILVYVRPDPGGAETMVRRARWTNAGPVEHFDFPAL